MRALIVEDNLPEAEAIRLILKKTGWSTDHVASAESALAALLSGKYDMALLDLMLPGADGFSILKQIRTAGCDVPIIVLTGLSDTQDVCDALRLGADEFLRKPIDAAEMRLRIDAVMRRCNRRMPNRLHVGTLELNLDEYAACIADVPLNLTRREFEVLKILALRKGARVSKEAFCAAMYDSPPRGKNHSNVVHVFVHKLRKKIDTAGQGGVQITSSWGEGYSLQVS